MDWPTYILCGLWCRMVKLEIVEPCDLLKTTEGETRFIGEGHHFNVVGCCCMNTGKVEAGHRYKIQGMSYQSQDRVQVDLTGNGQLKDIEIYELFAFNKFIVTREL